jgi:hypothetical protein
MIKKLILTTGIIACCFVLGYAQEEATPAKMFDMYVGVQANELINQIINLNTNATPVSNPYLLTFAINLNKSGWGLEGGIGNNLSNSKDVNAPVLNEVDINNIFYRIGFGRTLMVGKRLQIGYYLDFKVDHQIDKTITGTNTVFSTTESDSSISSTTTKNIGIGFGPKFQIGYYLSKHLILGTEITYYYTTSKLKQNANTTDYTINTVNGNSTTIINSNFETDAASFSITFPTALFLIYKF